MEGRYVHEITSENRQLIQRDLLAVRTNCTGCWGNPLPMRLVLSESILRLSFSNGDMLTLIDDTDQYESFIISFHQV
jgi:hypothetical protein